MEYNVTSVAKAIVKVKSKKLRKSLQQVHDRSLRMRIVSDYIKENPNFAKICYKAGFTVDSLLNTL